MTKWEEEVKKDYEEILRRNNFKRLNFSSWMTSYIFGFSLIAIAIGILMLASYFYRKYGLTPIIIGVVISLVVIILAILVFVARAKMIKIEKEILNSLNFSYYYGLALKAMSNEELELISLVNEFNIAPINFIPQSGRNCTDEILNFVDNNGVQYSYGTNYKN